MNLLEQMRLVLELMRIREHTSIDQATKDVIFALGELRKHHDQVQLLEPVSKSQV